MKTLQLVVCLLFTTHFMYSQETIPASGGEATGSGGSSSFSVGQLVYTTNTGNGTVTQGVQQSIELFTLTNPELSAVNLKAVTYPNPTKDHVVLSLSQSNLKGLSYLLYDLLGRVVGKGLVNQEKTQIPMQHLEGAVYLLKVNQNDQEIKSFKIIKK